MHRRIGLTALVVVLAALTFAVAATRADIIGCCTYGHQNYTPGTIRGGVYDCPLLDKLWGGNKFWKNAYAKGAAIFINQNGNWIGKAEDSNYVTTLWRWDLASVTKKGAVKNTSPFTYVGIGEVYYNDQAGCV